ncbi:MAG: rhamnulokinase [Leucobacter sp.]
MSQGSPLNIAVDLGATSGRVILGSASQNALHFETVTRFQNAPLRAEGTLHWNVLDLWRGITTGLQRVFADHDEIASIGVDSWGVDYALLRSGLMLSNPVHYRDERTPLGAERVHQSISREELFEINGLQYMSINTNYQLSVEHDRPFLPLADKLVMIPDLFALWLSGNAVAELTNASTSGLLDVRSQQWSPRIAELSGISLDLLPGIVSAGHKIGTLTDSVAQTMGAKRPVQVTAVGSHDTASAVAAIPMEAENAAYVSCGTWSLVGVEVSEPVLSEEARVANYTNELGVDGRVRFLKNVMGLWLLNETIRAWEDAGEKIDLKEALAAAAAEPPTEHVFDVTDDRFLPTGDMPRRINEWYRDHNLPGPTTRSEFVRCIIESLAQALADEARGAGAVAGVDVRKIHIVGGGSLNELLCQRTADRSGLPVLAGPVEATAIGNILVQARAAGSISGDLENLRDLVARTQAPKPYMPEPTRR